MADFIWADHRELVITTNKIVFTLDLNTIEEYIKNINDINSNEVMSSRLFQSKLYLKILGIPYFIKDSSTPITTDMVEKIIQSPHIFNDIILVY